MSYQMCPNFINLALNNIPLNKCYPYHHLQSSSSSSSFISQYFSTTHLYILLIFLLIILYTNLKNTHNLLFKCYQICSPISESLYNLIIFFLIYTNLPGTLIKFTCNAFFFLPLSPLNHSLLSNLIYRHFLFSNLILFLSFHPLPYFKSILLSILLCFLDFLLLFLDCLYELTHFTIIYLTFFLSFLKCKIDLIKETLTISQ
jgi:hypothetical protein